MFDAPGCLCRPAAFLSRGVAITFGVAGFCLASPLYRGSAREWISAGLRQLLELRRIAA